MRIGAVSFQPYIYNTNYINGNSLGKVAAISDDLLTAKTDYSDLTDESLNINPLRKGESANFTDILQMQFQTGRMNAERLVKPTEELQEFSQDEGSDALTEDAQQQMSAVMQDRNLYMMQKASEAYRVNMIA